MLLDYSRPGGIGGLKSAVKLTKDRREEIDTTVGKDRVSEPVLKEGTRLGDQSRSLTDEVLSWVISDVGSLVMGTGGVLILLLARLVSPSPTLEDSAVSLVGETRVNLLAILACGSVLLNGLTKLDISSVTAETVALKGTLVKEPFILVQNDEDSLNYSWLLRAVLAATPTAKTAVILTRQTGSTSKSDDIAWHVQGFGGIISDALRYSMTQDNDDTNGPIAMASDRFDATPILNRLALTTEENEMYLPNLQALPGRIEFDPFLPGNTQAALLVPVNTGTNVAVLALGSNQARSFTPIDIAWCRVAVACLR